MKERADRPLGVMAAMDDVLLQDPPTEVFPQEGQGPTLSLLYEYQTEGKIGGVPVTEQDRGLPIHSEDELLAAFVPVRRPRVLALYVRPGDEDAQARYDELLAKVYEGKAIIVDESREWDQAGARFALWVRYDEVHYELNPRFAYLRG